MAVPSLILLYEVVITECVEEVVYGGDLSILVSQLAGDFLQPTVEGLPDQLIRVQEAIHHEL